MSFLVNMALGANLINGLYGAHYQSEAALEMGQARANEILISSENQARIAEGQAQTDQFNAKLAEQLAGSETDQAASQAHDYRRTYAAKLANSRATFAASGLALEGSPLMVDENAMATIEYGASRIAANGMLRASRLRNQAKLLRGQSARDLASARYARSAGDIARQSALAAGQIGSDSATFAGWGQFFNTSARIGSSLAGKQVTWA